MANNTKKPASTKLTTPTDKVEVAPVEAVETNPTTIENEVLKAQLEEMKAQMALMMSQMAMQAQVATTNAPKKERNIPFINLTQGTFILKGSQIWEIEGQFAQRYFLEREARIILNNMPNAIHSGLVYIADAQFVQENDLEETYRFLLDNEQLNSLLDNKYEYILELYKNASPAQQQIVIDMIVAKRENGESVDANVLLELGRLSGKDLINIKPEEG